MYVGCSGISTSESEEEPANASVGSAEGGNFR